MALFKFTKNILKKAMFNKGNHERDFTYIDDAVNLTLLVTQPPNKTKILLIEFLTGSSSPIKLKNLYK